MSRKKMALIGLGVLLAGIVTVFLLFWEGLIWHLAPDTALFSVKGLDISHFQGAIDWAELDPEYRFIFMKATEGDDWVDQQFANNWQNAQAAGLRVGAYHFFHFAVAGQLQAQNFIQTVGPYTDLPPVLDVEFVGNTWSYDIALIKQELRVAITELEKFYGQRVILYTSYDAYDAIIKGSFDQPMWMRSVLLPVDTQIPGLQFWQYHDRATVQGISAKVDLNVFYGSQDQFDDLFAAPADGP